MDVSEALPKRVTKKTVMPNNSNDHLSAMQFNEECKRSAKEVEDKGKKKIDLLEKGDPIIIDLGEDKLTSQKEFEEWLEKEEEVLKSMREYCDIAKVLKKLKRKKNFNMVMYSFSIPYRLKTQEDWDSFKSFMGEYFLRMKGIGSDFRPVSYDLYRGTRSPEFQIDMELFAKIMQDNEANRRKNYRKHRFERFLNFFGLTRLTEVKKSFGRKRLTKKKTQL